MSRITGVLNALRAEGRKALIPYITGGDPAPEHTLSLMNTLVEAGADIIELGIPFSDPMADGPVIQLACERALAHGTSLNQLLDIVKEFRQSNNDTPVVLMGYLNPLEMKGYETFAKEAAAAGVDGVLTVDLPPEEADALVPVLKENDLDAVFLIAPTTTDARIESICKHSSGYVYYVSVKGVTGSSELDTDEVAKKVAHIKSLGDIPVGVGFGIKDADTAAKVASVSDGVIVGSVIVNMIGENKDTPENIHAPMKDLLASMRSAMDGN